MQLQPQQDIFRKRLPFVIIALTVATAALLGRLATLQYQSPEVLNYLERVRNSNYNDTLQLAASRGRIYDRDLEPLAVNTLDYEIGISPNLVAEPRETATTLASILELNELEAFEMVSSNQPWVSLAKPVSAEVAQQIGQADLGGVTIDPIPRRQYPQGTLAAQIIGFVGEDLQGYYGVEGFYQDQLAGLVRDRQVSNIPFDVPQDFGGDRGKDIVLTIDRDIQFLVESELQHAVTESGASEGTIIIMDPRNGDILAMASYPTFDPNFYYDVVDPTLLRNPAIGEQYEPGSVMKVLTVAAAIEDGAITPGWTYNDQGILEMGGITIQNWDRNAHGLVDTTQLLVESLNVGAATVATELGPTNFYSMMSSFGIGRATGIDLQGEQAGMMFVPGDPDWSESQLGTNSFGQGVATTPLQMLTAVSALANGGLMMQPHVVHQIIDGTEIYTSQPSALGRPISAETAGILTEMMVSVVNDGVDEAGIAGYTIAGKTGTAQIPTPLGYENDSSIVTFIGFLPADDPVAVVLVKLDRPREYWGSLVAAPVFRRLAERLVIMLEIPPDDIRHALAAEGGAVGHINR